MKLISTLVKTALITTAIAAASSSFAGTRCDLGSTCSVPNSTDTVYFEFTPDQGDKFHCELQATKNSDLEVAISGDKDYDFSSQEVRANKDGKTLEVSIPGHYKADAKLGQIVVRQSVLTLNAEGQVKCEPVK